MKTDEERQHIREIAASRRQTAALLCRQVGVQLTQLAEGRYRLKRSVYQLRSIQSACHGAPAGKRDREMTALIKLLRRMPPCT